VGNNNVVGSKGEEDATQLQIAAHHFKYAFDHVLTSVSRKDRATFDRLRERMARARTRGGGKNTANGEENEGGDNDVKNVTT
jgi:hypothetical protein